MHEASGAVENITFKEVKAFLVGLNKRWQESDTTLHVIAISTTHSVISECPLL